MRREAGRVLGRVFGDPRPCAPTGHMTVLSEGAERLAESWRRGLTVCEEHTALSTHQHVFGCRL